MRSRRPDNLLEVARRKIAEGKRELAEGAPRFQSDHRKSQNRAIKIPRRPARSMSFNAA